MKQPEYHPGLFLHWFKLSVRFRDLDPLNHVNNSVYNTYYEEARIDFVKSVPEFRDSMNLGLSFILVHLEIDYLKPILLNNSLIIGSAVEEYGNTSIKGFQAIYDKQTKELKSTARTTGVWFDIKKQRPVRLPEIEFPERYLLRGLKNG
ncbi:MAG: acyl-CoA thioesterase [Balneolaceae bacterium]|nr:MAG: acyl-CoA thioesterase [Balneolaceae bacterium]